MVIIQAFEVKVLTHKLRRPHHLIVTYKFVLINLHEKKIWLVRCCSYMTRTWCIVIMKVLPLYTMYKLAFFTFCNLHWKVLGILM